MCERSLDPKNSEGVTFEPPKKCWTPPPTPPAMYTVSSPLGPDRHPGVQWMPTF